MTGEENESRGEGGCLAGDEHENNGGDGRVEASVAHLTGPTDNIRWSRTRYSLLH